MQPSIFGKDLATVEFADIVAFCNQQTKEGLGLDYKKDLSSLPNIVKALASFANTNGGWLIIGVDDENDRPKIPVVGMKNEDNYEQRVNNSIISSVSPIILPRYKKCTSPDGKAAFLVAYMPQSGMAPHFMQYKGKNILFIRVADRANGQDWEDYASALQWEMLRNRRESSVGLRKQLIASMEHVYEASAAQEEHLRHLHDTFKKPKSVGELAAAAFTPSPSDDNRFYRRAQRIDILPEFPTVQVTDVSTLQHVFNYEPVRNGLSVVHPLTPDLRGNDTKTYQTGVYTTYYEPSHSQYYFFGVDEFGNVVNIDPMEMSRRVPDDLLGEKYENFVDLRQIAMQIVGSLQFAHKLYSKIGLIGNLSFRVEFIGSRGCLLFAVQAGLPYDIDNEPENVTGYYAIKREFNTDMLGDAATRDEFVIGILQEILYSFNYGDVTRETLLALVQSADGK